MKLLSHVPYEQSQLLVQMMKSCECNCLAAPCADSQRKRVLSSTRPLGNWMAKLLDKGEAILPAHLHKKGYARKLESYRTYSTGGHATTTRDNYVIRVPLYVT